jgi:hypothetical protein
VSTRKGSRTAFFGKCKKSEIVYIIFSKEARWGSPVDDRRSNTLKKKKKKKSAYRQHLALLYLCDSGVPILYNKFKSIPWVLSIP